MPYNVPLVRICLVKERTYSYEDERIDTPQKAAAFFRKVIDNPDREYLVVCCMDNQCHPLTTEIVSIGSISSCPVSIPEVFKGAFLANASQIIVFHNHPSGSLIASPDDIAVTKQLFEAGQILGIPIADHIIVTDNGYCSLKEHS